MAHWVFSGGTNYNDQSGTVAIVIAKANANITVNGYTGVYDGAAHGATGTASGVEASPADLSSLLHLGASFTNVPGGTAHWTFDGNINYNSDSGDVAIIINKANATVTVTPYSVTYDATSHTATGSATGVLSESLAGLDLSGTTHTNAGSYADSWTFTDVTGNYNDASGTVNNSIAKADTSVVVSGYTGGTYDGNAHTQTVTVTGVPSDGQLYTTSLTGTNAGSYSLPWSYTNNNNYNDVSGTLAFVIAKANANITVNGYTGVYDGAAHGATGTASGVKGEDLRSLLNLGVAYTGAGSYTVAWSFAGNQNYNPADGTVSVVINKAALQVQANSATKTYDGLAYSGGNGVSYAGFVNGEGPSVLGGSLIYGGSSQGAVDAGSYTISVSSLTSKNYQITYLDGTLTIGKKSIGGDAVTQSALNVAKMGTLDFTITSNQLAAGDTMAVFAGAEFTLTIGTKVYSVESTATADGNTVYVSWRMSDELKADLSSYLQTGATSASKAGNLSLIVSTSTKDYTFSDDFITKLFSSTK
jgi:hypothetical protein